MILVCTVGDHSGMIGGHETYSTSARLTDSSAATHDNFHDADESMIALAGTNLGMW